MSGVDSYGEVAAGLDLAKRAACAPGWDKRPVLRQAQDDRGDFDQRPGALEATRCAPPVHVAGRKAGDRWMVLALIGGFQVTMSAAAARALAGQLVMYAGLCERPSRRGFAPPQDERSFETRLAGAPQDERDFGA